MEQDLTITYPRIFIAFFTHLTNFFLCSFHHDYLLFYAVSLNQPFYTVFVQIFLSAFFTTANFFYHIHHIQVLIPFPSQSPFLIVFTTNTFYSVFSTSEFHNVSLHLSFYNFFTTSTNIFIPHINVNCKLSMLFCHVYDGRMIMLFSKLHSERFCNENDFPYYNNWYPCKFITPQN